MNFFTDQYDPKNLGPPIIVGTVEHTGTFALLRELGWGIDGTGTQVIPIEEAQRAVAGQVIRGHTYSKNMDYFLWWGHKYPMILTTRLRSDTETSWISRGKKVDDGNLDEQLSNLEVLKLFSPRIVQLDRTDGIRVIT